MDEQLSKDLEKARADLSNQIAVVDELKNALLDKDKELKSLKDSLNSVTVAKDAAEAELAKIAQAKKDAELMGFIAKEVELGITDSAEKAKKERLDALRKLNDDALTIYVGMLTLHEKAKDNASGSRKTVENNATPVGATEASALKAQLEAAFGIKKKN